jgi:hypothetical protein
MPGHRATDTIHRLSTVQVSPAHFLRAHLGELDHACGLIAFDGHFKLLRRPGHAHHRWGIEPARMLALSRRIAAGHSSPAHSLE